MVGVSSAAAANETALTVSWGACCRVGASVVVGPAPLVTSIRALIGQGTVM